MQVSQNYSSCVLQTISLFLHCVKFLKIHVTVFPAMELTIFYDRQMDGQTPMTKQYVS